MNAKVYREERKGQKGYPYQVLVIEFENGFKKNTGFLNDAEKILLKDVPLKESK